MKVAVLVFPGSTGDIESYKAVEEVLQQPAAYVPYTAEDLSKYDMIILPGGASYGDALRPGAIASRMRVMEEVRKAAEAGRYVLGVGNGFQILLESGLLPGVMLPNESLKFRCQQVSLRVENNRTPYTSEYEAGEVIQLPIAHRFGNYYCDDATLTKLKEKGQIVFRYAGENPNGSLDEIAGICNEQGNVLGMMPHPERAIDQLLGSEDGKRVFTSVLKAWRENHGTTSIR